MAELTIKEYHPTEKLTGQLYSLFLQYPTMFYKEDLPIIRQRLGEDSVPGYPKYVGMVNEIPVGFVCCAHPKDSAEIWFLSWYVVDQNFQNQGFGTILLRYIEQVIAQSVYPHLYIDTVLSNDPVTTKTNSFYEKHGYRKVGEIPNYYSEGENKAIYYKSVG